MGENRSMRIGELSSHSGVSVRSLRYYEEQRLLDPERTAGGQRVYAAEHLTLVVQIQELFQAGFCSSVIQELLPALNSPAHGTHQLQAAFNAATARLESEKESIEIELTALSQMRARLGLAPDTHVSLHGGDHDSSPAAPPTPFDHRDRRLR
ncbi:MAG: MerR family transcriptional regulator [Kineosporiaceae bacterium]|nr:MerR family transcriptional regulator [Aeromicrobium sp.]